MPYLLADDGVPLYYTDQGHGNPIVLLHGWTMNHKFFKRNAKALARTHRVVAFDIRGHGYSGKQELNWTLRQAAKDCRAIIDHLDLRGVTLAGWSMGTTLIHNYFDQFGYDNIKRAVFIDMMPYLITTPDWEHGAYGTLDYQAAYKSQREALEDRLGLMEDFIPGCFKGGRVPDEATKDWWIRESMLTPTSAMTAFWVAMIANDWRHQLPQIAVPVLLCYGAQSIVCPTALGQHLNETIPDSTLVTFEQSGHAPFWEEPEKFNEAVASFAG